MTLQLKYRPKSFKTFRGNDDQIAQLRALLAREDVPRAYLIEGPSGTGKTTLGRLITREVGCKKSEFHELNAADFNGVDTVREIRKKMNYAPSAGAWRIWLFDEAHEISPKAQALNCLRKREQPSSIRSGRLTRR